MKGRLTSVYIICSPLKHTSMLYVQVNAKKEVTAFGPLSAGEHIIPISLASSLIRQTALNANLACCVVNDHRVDFSTNWEERLKLVSNFLRLLILYSIIIRHISLI